MVANPVSLIVVPTAHFGAVEVPAAAVLRLTAPLMPFVGVERYVLLAHPEEAPFAWLQAVDEPGLALVVAPYAEVAGAPPPPPPPAVARELGDPAPEAVTAYAVIALGATPAATTANLLAPLYVCPATARARQVVLEGALEQTRAPLGQPTAGCG